MYYIKAAKPHEVLYWNVYFTLKNFFIDFIELNEQNKGKRRIVCSINE